MTGKMTVRTAVVAALGGGTCLAAAIYFVPADAAAAGGANDGKIEATPIVATDLNVQFNPLHRGQLDFVVSDIRYALGPDADKAGTCPTGMTSTAADLFRASPEGRKREDETDQAYAQRMRSLFMRQRSGPDACMSPELVGPDANFRTVGISNVVVPGIDLDGQTSTGKKRPAAGTCAHDDFQSASGGAGIDNQLYRAVGCTKGFQTTGSKNSWVIGMLTGSWGIVVSVKGVDNPVNDSDVEVGIHANADPIQLSPARNPLTHISYSIDPDSRFQARTRGRIVNGVLTTDPVDVRFHHDVNALMLERSVKDARLRMKINQDGSIEGILAGYADVDELYDVMVGMRNAKDVKGNPATEQRKRGTAGGSASSAGFTCNGMYHALKQLADGHRDPATGKCTAISVQYQIKAVPAFVVDGTAPGTTVAKAR